MSAPAPAEERRGRRLSGRTAWVLGLLVCVLVAGGISWFASGHPDGLEFVAGQTGFADAGRDSATAGGPLSDYRTEGVDNSWLSGAVAGVVGCAVVLLLMTAVALVVRRRRR
ncbi:PDGLE domain-containing protein [Nocardioides sp. CFH 31398]|uniref:PDGLE domain-containing protein n=1 Tax=Nocardioides sp. CFH 31398 TaxID=2919579 RepID=UPI001F058BF2|nr:PDGLE domain-containing protein [Nocardioides sp. CFH 31398]MCH1867177.1 PDGLE domain-containing protein [Nocardioides sp. CFH 31398]